MGSRNLPKIYQNLSSQKTESTIVLTVLQSKSQMVSSHRRRRKRKRNRSGLTFEKNKGIPQILHSKWSSGRACGAASTTQRPRSASLRSHAPDSQQASKQASKKKKRKEKKDKREKTEKKKEAQKEPNDLQQFYTKMTYKLHQHGTRNNTKSSK